MKLYNTMSRQNEEFTPQKDGEATIYTCGLTVYSQPHIGNWVAYIYWDVLQRTLEQSGYKVNRIQNITDVGHLTSDEDAGEDKMLASALKEGKTAWEIADKYIKIAEDEANSLGLIKPNLARATDYIEQQIKFVQLLEEKGYTYTLRDGVYFDTSKLNDYGKLARLDIQGLQFGARVSDTGKKNPTDFALWKFSPKDQKRDMEWESPWGIGFPGWHLECSAIILELLGETIDIHNGGIDHIPVHHTNEIAQSETLTEKPLSRYWVHANHIKVDGQKMSKSLGNIYTLKDITDRGFSLDDFKLMVLSKHYRTEGNFTWDILEASAQRLERWRQTYSLVWQISDLNESEDNSSLVEAITNDLNTAKSVAEIDSIMNEVETKKRGKEKLLFVSDYLKKYFGIDISSEDISEEQKSQISERQQVRASKNWQKSDMLRDKLLEQKIGLNDTPERTVWFRL
jgi:cysteinyl-tRNA synthetase